MNFVKVTLLIFCACSLTSDAATTGFILLGSLGDLARKYLWSSLIQNFSTDMRIFGASRSSEDVGSVSLAMLLNDVPGINEKFLNRVEYLQLKTEYDFRAFCEINQKLKKMIFYMSIPPSAYVSTSQFIQKHCKKKGISLKVAYEKPFGYDVESSHNLFSELGKLFEQSEIYLIDHYLGKAVTQSILPVRRKSDEIEARLNNNHVSKIEVTLLEVLDCEGRAGYYDKSGVIRDMLQNHATELLTLITCELTGDIIESKVRFLESLTSPNSQQIVLGQYDEYESHVGTSTSTPTFASVLLTSSSKRWSGVPIVLTSGKSQRRERKEVVVTFKTGDVLKFDFKPSSITYNGKELFQFKTSAGSNSYIPLLKAVLSGDKVLLPSVNTVNASWKLWNILLARKGLIKHKSGTDLVVESMGRLLLVRNETVSLKLMPRKFINNGNLVTASQDDLYRVIVDDFIKVVNRKNGVVHIALSGGSSVLGVYKNMILKKGLIPWDRIHIWQVDERCELSESNYAQMKFFLLDFVEIVEERVHRVKVTESGCGSVAEYSKEFSNILSDHVMDYVLLGVGSDGHTASIFPKEEVLESGEYFKIVKVNTKISPVRFTMTMDLINRSGRVIVLVVGDGKSGVVEALRGGEKFPVSDLCCEQVKWFVEKSLIEAETLLKDHKDEL